MKTRRIFLVGMVLAGVASELAGHSLRGQAPPGVPAQEPKPGHEPKPGNEPSPEAPALPNAEKRILEDNDKDMKKKVDRLYQLAAELKAQVDKTDSSKVLSLNLVRKAEEIEKLARDIKNRSKG
jgi:hypothetical protein